MAKKFFNTELVKEEIKEPKKIKEKKVKVKSEGEEISFKVVFVNLILFLFIIALGGKAYLVYKYDLSDEITTMHNDIVFNITYLNNYYELTSKSYDDVDYLTFQNIKIFNVFNEFEIEYDDNYHVCYFLEGETSTCISIEDNQISSIKNEYKEDEVGIFSLIFSSFDNEELASEYLNSNDINNESDLILSLDEDFSTTFLTSVETLKYNYAKGYLISSLFETDAEITLISGDYIGYISEVYENDEVTTKYTLIKDDVNYIFTFHNSDYYTDNELNNIINSIIID